MSKKQTAVEWLESEIKKLNISVNGGTQVSAIRIFEQAKAMEKEQIIESRVTSLMTSGDVMLDRAEAEHYYTETYEQ